MNTNDKKDDNAIAVECEGMITEEQLRTLGGARFDFAEPLPATCHYHYCPKSRTFFMCCK